MFITSIAIIAIVTFVGLALLILFSQGITQGINILTIISILVGYTIGILSLLVSFLQWHHPKSPTEAHPLSSHLPTASHANESQAQPISAPPSTSDHLIDWGDAPLAIQFYGRDEELMYIKEWIVGHQCRVIALVGMGGIGKTALAARVTEQVQGHFTFVFWRSLQNAPPFKDVVHECLQFFSRQQHLSLPNDDKGLIAHLLAYCRKARCLLVFDNVESILQERTAAGSYREHYHSYGALFQCLGEAHHQSCLLLTSREKPKEIALLEGPTSSVRSYQLGGLKLVDAQGLFKEKGLQGDEQSWEALFDRYTGNPLALKLVAQFIREVFDGQIALFLKDHEAMFNDIRQVLDQQFERLSVLERDMLYWLAIAREAISLDELQASFFSPPAIRLLQECLRSLRKRHLVEANPPSVRLHHVILEYTTDRFIEQLGKEVSQGMIHLLNSHVLMQAHAKEYVRESQIRLLLLPAVGHLLALLGQEGLETTLRRFLSHLRRQPVQESGYAAGNILNMAVRQGELLSIDDFSHLLIRQAYLRGVTLRRVNFAQTRFEQSYFTDAFTEIWSLALSPDGKQVAIGTLDGPIWLWSLADEQPSLIYRGHQTVVWSVAFSPDGKLLASGSDDYTLCLWEGQTGIPLHVLGHSHEVTSVAFSPDGQMVASGCMDQHIRLWETRSGQCLRLLHGHTKGIRCLAFHPHGQVLASGGHDQTMRLWDIHSGKCLHTFHGHTQTVQSLAFSPDGQYLISGSHDQTLRLWEVSSGRCLSIFEGHTNRVNAVAFHPDGQTVASGGDDRRIVLWQVSSGASLHILQGHTQAVRALVFHPQGHLLASGGLDWAVRLWEIQSGYCLRTFQGYTQAVKAVAFSPDGHMLASGGQDRTVYLWDKQTGRSLHTLRGRSTRWVGALAFHPAGHTLASGGSDLVFWDVRAGHVLRSVRGHTEVVNAVAFSLDGRTLASGSDDYTVRLWAADTGECLRILQGHTNWVRAVAFSPDGISLASGSADHTIRIWEIKTGRCLQILQGHSDWIEDVTYSPDGTSLASGSKDHTIRLWEARTGECFQIFQGHTRWVHAVAFSPNGTSLASGSADQTIRVWAVSSGDCLHIFKGHTDPINALAFSPTESLIASGSDDGTVKLWNGSTGRCIKTLWGERPYERMNITGTQGLTEAQKLGLKALGAYEDEATEDNPS